ncbi:MAG TPA: hypothetical protein ENG74_01905 [Thermoplasmatales archaeon]|nr:hypothetical protein [Thermoplasmatales archaeon]
MTEISDEEAIEHFKRRLKKIPVEKQEKLKVVIGEKVYSVKDILSHMMAKDEIGKMELEIEKAYIRWLRERRKK